MGRSFTADRGGAGGTTGRTWVGLIAGLVANGGGGGGGMVGM